MPVIRDQWSERHLKLPPWVCPTCGKGRYKVVDNTLVELETGPSKREHSHDEWDPEWVEKRFVAIMRCDLISCGQVAAVSGDSGVLSFEEYTPEGEYDHSYGSYYKPKLITPAPIPIGLPSKTPKELKKAVSDAASLIWISPESAANKIRQAIEILMDEKTVRKTSIKNGKRTKLSLHARIVEFTKGDAGNGSTLLATKWLGNSGSHNGGVERDDVLDAFDMIEVVLDNLYETAKKEILRKVIAINKRKGPVKKRKDRWP